MSQLRHFPTDVYHGSVVSRVVCPSCALSSRRISMSVKLATYSATTSATTTKLLQNDIYGQLGHGKLKSGVYFFIASDLQGQKGQKVGNHKSARRYCSRSNFFGSKCSPGQGPEGQKVMTSFKFNFSKKKLI